jgi:ubiquinone/menaquinone biosynthesis C-methylase UbiE
MQTDYDKFSEIYDLVYDFDYDVNFYLRRARRAGGRVLEIGCGSGRISLSLARSGIQVTGIDNSTGMLALAREKLAREDERIRERVELIESDVRELDLGRRFDLIIFPFNSFMYLYTPEDQTRALTAIRKHMTDDGLFILSLFVPTPEITTFIPGVMNFQWKKKHPGGGEVYCWELKDVDTFYQLASARLIVDWVKPGGEVKRYVQEQTFRYFTHYEFSHLLERRGFFVLEMLGDFKSEDLGPGHRDMIFVAGLNPDWSE